LHSTADPRQMLEAVIQYTPEGPTHSGLKEALETPLDYDVRTAAARLGSGGQVISSDTVPFSLWCAAKCLRNYEEAMWTTVAGLGDRDTTCAIAGSVVALAVGSNGIPQLWLDHREPLNC
ncbi:MAG: ADP-ribosylglycohydrolase family protein, partial [Planctomycetaceae bacterium]|nr:ADP-ribosylglycohydrolase family protein [Planctomycetaceae bacterium]